MDIINQSILKSLESKQYFIDARIWYIRKYIYPITERSIMITFSLIFLIIAIIIACMINSLYPNQFKIPVAINIANSIDYSPKIDKINNKVDDPRLLIAKRLASYYVKNRESYNYPQLEEQSIKLSNLSTKFIYKEWYNNLSFDNPNSSINLYKDNHIRSIIIQSIDLNKLISNGLIINYQATVREIKTNQQVVNNYQVKLAYSMNELDINQQKFNFVVTEYESRQLK